jgi:hypothetical protein
MEPLNRKSDAGQLNAMLAVLEMPDRLAQMGEAILSLTQKIDRIDAWIQAAEKSTIQASNAKDFFSVEEAAREVGKAEFTVRKWCREGRINAEKRECGRGVYGEWIISRGEIIRYKNEGLLTPDEKRNPPTRRRRRQSPAADAREKGADSAGASAPSGGPSTRRSFVDRRP